MPRLKKLCGADSTWLKKFVPVLSVDEICKSPFPDTIYILSFRRLIIFDDKNSPTPALFFPYMGMYFRMYLIF